MAHEAQDWTEKHRPRSLDDVVGNSSARGDLKAWGEAWASGTPPDERAVILAGQPGVGKTSSAYALARDMGWGVVELNASDQRNYDVVKRIASSGAVNRAFRETGEWDASGGRQLVILDEADNLFGNADRGGMRAIIETIRETQQPIVLIANDAYELKRKGQALHGLAKEIKFHKVHKRSIPKALRGIAAAEGIEVEDGVLERLAEAADGDLRGAVNDLQALAMGRDRIRLEDAEAVSDRDDTPDIFDALGAIFYGDDLQEARQRTWDVDESPDHILLWVDENLPRIYKDPADLADGYHAVSRADIYLGRTRSTQHYGLWRYATDMMTAGVNAAKTTKPQGTRFQFPSWLKKMSRSRGNRNTRDAAAGKLGRVHHTSTRVARDDLVPTARALMRDDEDLAVELTAVLDLDKDELAYLIDMGESTKTVARILEHARERRDEMAEPRARGAFARFDDDPGSGPDAEAPHEDDEVQASLEDAADPGEAPPTSDGGDGDAGDEDARPAADDADEDESQRSLTDF